LAGANAPAASAVAAKTDTNWRNIEISPSARFSGWHSAS
jgi:hypothetical protein